MKLRDRVYVLSGGVYGQLGNVCLLQHSEGYLLIDSGNPNAYDTIIANLHYWNISEHDITHVLLTHGHDDHSGCAKLFQDLGAKIVIGAKDAEMLERGNFGLDSPYRNHQMPACHPDISIDADTILEVGDLCIHIYTMPGHSDGTLMFYVGVDHDILLFTGDMFYCDGEKGDLAFTGWKGDLSYQREKLEESFAKLWSLDLKPTLILGGHGIPIIGKQAKDSIMIAYKYFLLNNR